MQRLACPLLAAALLLLLPPAVGVAAGVTVLALGPRALARLEPAAVRRQREQLEADLPLVLDLLAACLAGGATVPAAAAAVGRAVGGPAAARVERVTVALDIGSSGRDAWLLLAGSDPERDPLGPAARTLSRAADSGSAVAQALTGAAVEARSRRRSAGTEAARRAGVLSVGPLTLCHLPAFVLLGVVPVVVGLAAPVLSAR